MGLFGSNTSTIFIVAVGKFFDFLNLMILIRVLLSWFPIRRDNVLVQLLLQLTEPILAPIRHLFEKSPIGGKGMMVDFSPIIAYFLLYYLRIIIISLLSQYL